MGGLGELGGDLAIPVSREDSEVLGGYKNKIPGINGLGFEVPDERFGENISIPTERSGS